jgi:threonine dehydrogenase-like Zn-dependent dehydrogenase
MIQISTGVNLHFWPAETRPEDFTRIIDLAETARIDTAPWITHRASFDDAVTEFPSWTKPETGVIKAMIEV